MLIFHPILQLVLRCILLASFPVSVAAELPEILLPDVSLNAQQLAIIINEDDPLSIKIGEYYQQARNIPESNLIRVRFNPDKPIVKPERFIPVWDKVQQDTPEGIQAYALTWAQPYRVGCMSITTAFASGFDKRWCSDSQCDMTQHSPLFENFDKRPYDGFRLRPTMTIAATSFKQAKELIDRGVLADKSQPTGTAYLLSTSDKNRNVRSVIYPLIEKHFQQRHVIKTLKQDNLKHKQDVFFYFTGRSHIQGLETLEFKPGAVADHLTSSGGQLTNSGQMSALKWLEAGATGSYGTVVEPCNHLGKFPNPGILMDHYLGGRTLIESYWASVQMPGEGIFIGEPLAKPFAGYRIESVDQGLLVTTHSLRPGLYNVEIAPSIIGPYSRIRQALTVKPGQTRFIFPDIGTAIFKITPISSP